MKELMKKKKFWVAVIGVGAIGLKYFFNVEIPVEKVADFMMLIFGF